MVEVRRDRSTCFNHFTVIREDTVYRDYLRQEVLRSIGVGDSTLVRHERVRLRPESDN